MTIYYSAANFSFYFSAVHGPFMAEAPDPGWHRPLVSVPDPNWVRPNVIVPDPDFMASGENQEPDMITVPDMAAEPVMIDVPDDEAQCPIISVRNPRVPDDAVEVSDADYAALMQAQSAGQRIIADGDGYPVAIDRDVAELAEMMRAKRDALLSASDWTQVADAPVDRTAWATYRHALRDVPDQPGFPNAIEWPVAPD